MKYLKKFNEELKPYTYRKAAAALKKMGHSRRASALTEWEEETKKREEIKARNELKAKLEKTPPFSMKFFRDKWNSSTRSRDFGQEPFFEGNFYIGGYFEEDWASDDESWEEYERDNTSTIQFSFGISIFPADEETQLRFEQEEWDNIWRNQAWPVNFTIRLNDGKTTLDQEKSETFWEEREDGVCLFSNRSEAMKFKRFLISSLSGGDDDFSKSFKDVKSFISNKIKSYNDKDNYYWTRVPSAGVPDHYEIKKIYNNDYYWSFGDKECNLKESDYNYFEKAIKRMSLNNLYRD